MRRVSRAMSAGLMFACIALITAGTIGAARQAVPSGNPEAKKLKNPVPATPASIAAGEQRYRKYCAFCHGKTGTGDGSLAPEGTNPANLTDDVWDHGSSDGEIFVVIRDGVGPKFDMEPFQIKLSEQDIWNLVNFIRSLGAQAKSR